MKMKALFYLLFTCISVFAQEGSYTIKCIKSDSKDTIINVVATNSTQSLVYAHNKLSQQPLDIMLSVKENNLTILGNEQSKTAVSFVLSDYISSLSQQFAEAATNYKLEKIEKPNSEFNYRYKSKDLSIEAVLSSEPSNLLQCLQILKLNPFLFTLQLPTDYSSIKQLFISNKGLETKIWINFEEQKIEDSVFQIPDSATKVVLDKSKISQNEYDNFVKNLNRSF